MVRVEISVGQCSRNQRLQQVANRKKNEKTLKSGYTNFESAVSLVINYY